MSKGTWHSTRVAETLQAHWDGPSAGSKKTLAALEAAYTAWRKSRGTASRRTLERPTRAEPTQRALFGGGDS